MLVTVRSCRALAVSALLVWAAVAGCSSDNTGAASGQDSSVAEGSATTGFPGGSSSSGGRSGNTCLSGTAAQCFTASSVTCTGLGTDACQCGATCSGIPFTWSCGSGVSCTAGSCANHCDVNCGGSACVAQCASLQSAVTAMQASTGMPGSTGSCGLFFESTSPFQSCQCAAGFDGGGSSSGGHGPSDGASSPPDVGTVTSDGATDAPESESGSMDASLSDASDASSDGSGNDSASSDSSSNDSSPNDASSNDAGGGDAGADEGTDGPVEAASDAAGDAASCSASTSGGPPGSCQQVRTCGSRIYVANCTAQGSGTCAANGVSTSTTYRCECGTPPAFLTTNGFSCAVVDAEGGLES